MKIRSLFFLIMLCSCLINMNAQTANNFTGSWAGKLDIGPGLRLVFHIRENNGHLVSSADSPDQSAFGLKCDTTWAAAGSITIEMHALNALYRARLLNDTTLEGTFTQGMDLPLRLVRTTAPPEKPKRPQEPMPPFPYKSEDVIYKDTKGLRQYGATITIPEGKGPFPAALLITGSGAQNRDEELLGHKTFAVLADALTRNGFIVLRVDDRGVGKTTGPFKGATSADFAEDAGYGLDYLLTRPEVNKKKVGLIGHSEGGMIAPMVASKRNDVDFIVLLAGPGVKISQLMTEQNAAISRFAGISDTAIHSFIEMYNAVNKEVLATEDSATALTKARRIIKSWMERTDTATLRELHMNMAESEQQVAISMVSELQDKWYRYFMMFDPTPYLESLRCKVLALNGSRDVQVLPASNLAGIQDALKKSRSKQYTVKELPGLNHLFQTCKTCSPAEYSLLEETFAPIALDEINNWLNKNVK